jgi:zinc/manganese transport system substrate-binding protein
MKTILEKGTQPSPSETSRPRGRRSLGALLPAVAVVSLLAAGCGSSDSAAGPGGKVAVVAAENFWGSVAAQIGGDRVSVTSIITNPDTDPHSYEPTPQDGRTLAGAKYVIVNGAGYDPWTTKLIDANPVTDRVVLDIGALNGVKDGGNPHMWYSPAYVGKVIDRVTEDLKKLDPSDAGYFEQQRNRYKSDGLNQYDQVRRQIKDKYSGTPVGATESIFVYLSDDLGLQLLTPPEYMKAISEGAEPTAQDKAAFDQQITQKKIKVLVYNKQNSTPDVQALVDKAKKQGIEVTAITETLDPATATFQEWQTKQLSDLLQALKTATGR